jgi:hypothetical protein
MKKIIRLTESDLTRIVKKIVLEQSEHVKNLYKSWANKKSGNPERALSIMDDVLKLQKQLPKKDFANYTSYEELLNDLNKIKQASKSEDVTKIYEDKDLLVMAANTWESSCKYGAGSKWCTTAKDDNSYWRRHNETGTEFFWIFKNKPQNDPNHKFSYHVKMNGEPDWCNAVNSCMSTTRLPEESYPKKHPRYSEIIEKLQEIHDARGLKDLENKKQEQLGQIVSWVETNLREISEELSRWGGLDMYTEETIDNFIQYEIYDIIPMSLELDDEEGIEKFQSVLEDEIYENFKPTVDEVILGYGFINGLAWLIAQEFVNPIEYLNNNTPKELLGELYDIDELGINELLSEEIGIYLQEEIHNFASRFAFDYRP